MHEAIGQPESGSGSVAPRDGESAAAPDVDHSGAALPQITAWGAVWRMLAFFFLWAIASVAAVAIIESYWRAASGNGVPGMFGNAVGELLGAVFASWVFLRYADRSRFAAIGLGSDALAPRALLFGLLLGAATIGIASLALLALNELHVFPAPHTGWWTAAGITAVVLLPAAFAEELVMRGYIFWTVRRRWGWKWAVGGTSVAFGLMHLANPGANAESIFAVMLAGVFLAAVFLATRSLYATGLCHFAWNWVMAGGLHSAVSGQPLPAPDYSIADNGPDWLTGGPWGPEGGAAAAAMMLLAISFLYRRRVRQMER